MRTEHRNVAQSARSVVHKTHNTPASSDVRTASMSSGPARPAVRCSWPTMTGTKHPRPVPDVPGRNGSTTL